MNGTPMRQIGYPAFIALCALLTASALALRWAGLPFITHDMDGFLLPWYGYIVTHGRFAALSDGFSNYTPPYLYLLTAVSYLDGAVNRVVLIKSISILFDVIAAWLIFKIVFRLSANYRRAVLLALLFLNLPTVILNGAVWGQCDIIFTTFLLAFAYSAITQRPFTAIVMYSVALSIKLQAIFAAPFVFYLLLAGAIPLAYILIPPVVYGLLILPAALIGRTVSSLLSVYADQADTAHKLSARAPNLYVIVQHFLPPDLSGPAVLIGVATAGLISLAILRTNLWMRPPLSGRFIVIAMALWVAVEPALLPKMHERYFFAADVFTFLWAAIMRRAWWVAVLFQIGSAFAYAYFMMLDKDFPIDLHPAAFLGSLAAIPATVGVAVYYWREIRPTRRAARDGTGAQLIPTLSANAEITVRRDSAQLPI